MIITKYIEIKCNTWTQFLSDIKKLNVCVPKKKKKHALINILFVLNTK